MEEQNYEYHFGAELPAGDAENGNRRSPKTVTRGFLIGCVAFAVALSVLLTSVLATIFAHSFYAQQLNEQQEMLDRWQKEGKLCELDVQNLEVLALLFERYSYYYGQVDNDELITAALRAYAEATGDRYAEYYTVEEYRALALENAGNHSGIGIGIYQTKVSVEGAEYAAFQVTEVYVGGPAASSGLRPGDYIYAYVDNGTVHTVSEVGYSAALAALRGAAGTTAEIFVYRMENGNAVSHRFAIERQAYVADSVSSYLSAADPTVAVVRISGFDLQTPMGLKREIRARMADGATKFVFDLRNNPGGDLQSVKASLTYFLQPGDLILNTIDRDGNVRDSYVAEPTSLRGSYASCSVAQEEVGMFSDLSMVVLCNGATASAAEVFTATLRDYGLATVVGETTFGKGIMQTFFDLSVFRGCEGYAKLTSYAYVTKCGVSYHDVGILPDVAVELSEEAQAYYYTLLPEALDNQLAAAIARFE